MSDVDFDHSSETIIEALGVSSERMEELGKRFNANGDTAPSEVIEDIIESDLDRKEKVSLLVYFDPSSSLSPENGFRLHGGKALSALSAMEDKDDAQASSMMLIVVASLMFGERDAIGMLEQAKLDIAKGEFELEEGDVEELKKKMEKEETESEPDDEKFHNSRMFA